MLIALGSPGAAVFVQVTGAIKIGSVVTVQKIEGTSDGFLGEPNWGAGTQFRLKRFMGQLKFGAAEVLVDVYAADRA
ncbi:hypothetical protein HYW55_01265 [Candidatus Gottesmanbacteria bacterium]|nr:hypothetical protein [Candidatus Gottesmanbacteria bacterium]